MELTDIEAVDVAYIENIQRQNLNPIEEANMYLTRIKLMPEFLEEKVTLESFHSESKPIIKLGKLYSVSSITIARRLDLLLFPKILQNAVALEDFPLSIPREIARFRQIPETDLREKYVLFIFHKIVGNLDRN